MIRIGIICPSEIAIRRFLPALMKHDDFEFVGIATPAIDEFKGATEQVLKNEFAKATKVIDEFGGVVFKSYFDIVTSESIDALYIPLPPSLHFKWAKLALESGKHVLLEKPSTTKLSETRLLINTAMANNVALFENYMFIYHKQIDEINNIIKEGALGDIRLLRISFGFPKRDERDFRYNKELGGGALLDCGGYTIKYANLLLGDTSQIVQSQMNYISGYEVDMYGSGVLKNSDGIIAQVSFGMDNSYKCELEIWGSKGFFQTDRVLTAPVGYKPTYKIMIGSKVETFELSHDDSFFKSIMEFKKCILNAEVRKLQFEEIEKQSNFVEQFKNLTI